ncbi:DUF3311 domain-containing protein [Pandoraea anhela]|uniref:DUF3311 domain-containing protein n=1 Tax=Pandoraea anhela TaxID=2508295 RepID=A0A5E4R9R1_9BURK|nr:DUF3311 domain-containing protein [Pandoraea anhela]VVD59272.1 hypothetical protein PAN31108_00019 [Pandoraea anhela]
MPHTASKPGSPRSHRYRWLLVVPFLWQACLAPVVNDISWTPFGIPFPMFWQMAGIVVASLLIGLVFRLDKLAGVEAEEAAFLLATSQCAGERQ